MENEIKLEVPTRTTAAGLTRLAAGIFELLHDNSIDSRFVAELLERMEKEAQSVIETPVEAVKSADEFALRDALAQLRRPFNQSETDLLVQTHARLRANDQRSLRQKRSKKTAPTI